MNLCHPPGPVPKREKYAKTPKRFMEWLRTLPCFRCLKPSQSVVAHINQGLHAKGMKSDLMVPLCTECHQTAPDAQHKTNEARWWVLNGFPNIKEAAAYLRAHSGDLDAYAVARQIARSEK